MNKEFIPYEETSSLIALGFKEPVIAHRKDGLNICLLEHPEVLLTDLSMILYQQAFRWFRKQYKLIFFVFPQIEDGGCEYQIVHYNPHKIMYKVYSKGMTYEEAELACLRKLIEIVENKSE